SLDFPDGHLFHQRRALVPRLRAVAFDVLVERRPHPLGEQEPARRRRLLRIDHQCLIVELTRFLRRERRFPALRPTPPLPNYVPGTRSQRWAYRSAGMSAPDPEYSQSTAT